MNIRINTVFLVLNGQFNSVKIGLSDLFLELVYTGYLPGFFRNFLKHHRLYIVKNLKIYFRNINLFNN